MIYKVKHDDPDLANALKYAKREIFIERKHFVKVGEEEKQRYHR